MMQIRNKKNYFWTTMKIVIALFIFYMLVKHSQLKFELLTTLFQHPFYLLTAVGLLFLSTFSNATRWYRLNLSQQISLPFMTSCIATYIGVAFNSLLPGSVGGDFVRCYYVMKHFPDRKANAVLSTFLDRACGLMIIMMIISVVLIYRFDLLATHTHLVSMFKICMSIILMTLLFFLIAHLFLHRFKLSQKLTNYVIDKPWVQWILIPFEMINAFKAVKVKLTLVEGLFYSFMTQLLLLAVLLLINTMMGLPAISAYVFLLALAVAQIANLIPLTPGGIGIGEVAFANVVLIFSPDGASASATVFLAFRLLMMLVYIPGALIGLFGKWRFNPDALS